MEINNMFLDLIEEVFSERNSRIENELFILEFTEIVFQKKAILTFELYLNINKQNDKVPLLIDGGILEVKEIQKLMVRLQNEYNEIIKFEKEIEYWGTLVLDKLIEMEIQYTESKDVSLTVTIEEHNKSIIILDDFFIVESLMSPYIMNIHSYEKLDIIFEMIGKEKRKFNMESLYADN
jgi:hypothetical protein